MPFTLLLTVSFVPSLPTTVKLKMSFPVSSRVSMLFVPANVVVTTASYLFSKFRLPALSDLVIVSVPSLLSFTFTVTV